MEIILLIVGFVVCLGISLLLLKPFFELLFNEGKND